MSPTPTIEGTSTPARWWRPLVRSDRWALLWFLIIPALLFIVPALAGRPAIDADNLIQNFPLRVLAGRQLASGHLPLLNPLADSGAPLLGGLNAGALYPLTVIFAFVPAIAAWVINLIAVYVTAGVGLFALLRWHGLQTWPAFVAGVSYAYTGAMIGQMIHLGVIQGYSFLPWAVLIMIALSRRLRGLERSASARVLLLAAAPWVLAVAALWGLTFLSGEPRAISDVELLTIVVVPGVLLLRSSYWLTTWRGRAIYASTLLVGFVFGLGLGLVQMLPGWSFITFSQRSQVSYGFFGAGSLAVRWSNLLLTPDLFGGNGAFGQPGFFANYNLAEVTGYAGVVALMAGAAFLTRLTWKGWRGAERDYVLYVVLGVVGLFAAWGSFTPVGHLFRAIPLFGSTRLQSRNIILVDLALAVMLGWWLQQLQDRARAREEAPARVAGLDGGARWVSALPALAVVALSVALLGWGPWVIRHVSISSDRAYLESQLTLVNALHLAIALAAVAVVLTLGTSPRLFRAIVAIVVADVVVFLTFTATGVIGGSGPREPSRAAAVAALGVKGRFALVDLAGSHTGDFRAIGEPNMNVFTGLASVQGYGSLLSTIYDESTGTHPQAMVNACHLAQGTFTQLRLDAIAIATSELATNVVLSPTPPTTCVSPAPATSVDRYFGRLLYVHEVILTNAGSPLSRGALSLQLLNAHGQPEGAVVAASAASPLKAVFALPRTLLAAGFVLTSPAPISVASTVVAPYGTTVSYQLSTVFQLAISSTAWRLTSTEEGFSVFKATMLLAPAWLPATSEGTVTNVHSSSWGDTWVTVRLPHAAVLERSEEYLPGWRATAVNAATGRTVTLVVRRAGLIQKVEVPQGDWTIDFHYHAPYIEVSVIVSAASLVLFLGALAAFVVSRRRRLADKVHS